MDKPPKSGKDRRKKNEPYGDSDQIPAGGRARERILQHQKSRGLEDQTEATGEFSESVESIDDAITEQSANCPGDDIEGEGKGDEHPKSANCEDEESKSQQDP